LDKSLDQQLIEKKAEAWDLSIFIQARQLEFQKFIAPHDAKLNRLIGEINNLSVQKKQAEKQAPAEGQKIVVTNFDQQKDLPDAE